MSFVESLFYDLFAFGLAFGLGCALAIFGFFTLDYARRIGLGGRVTGALRLIFFALPFMIGLQLLFDPSPAIGFFVGLGFMLYRNRKARPVDETGA